MISLHLDQYLHSNYQNIFSSLDHSVQKRELIFYHCEAHHKAVQYSYVSTLSINKFHAMLMKEHPENISHLKN